MQWKAYLTALVSMCIISVALLALNSDTTWILTRQRINGNGNINGVFYRPQEARIGTVQVSTDRSLLKRDFTPDHRLPCTEAGILHSLPRNSIGKSLASSLYDVIQPTETKANHTLAFDATAFREPLTEVTQVPISFLPNYRNPCWVETLPHTTPDSNLREGFLADSASDAVIRKLRSLQDTSGHTWRLRCLPYFYLAGFPKCGTTDLYGKITLHPEISEASIKEMQWWGRRRWGRGGPGGDSYRPESFDSYLRYFQKSSECILRHYQHPDSGDEWHHMVTGDGSPATLWDNHHWSDFPENRNFTEPTVLSMHLIRQLTPSAKFIVIAREPTERCFSDYVSIQGEPHKSPELFHEVVQSSIAAFKKCHTLRSRRRCLYDDENDIDKDGRSIRLRRLRIGLYSEFLEEWLEVFPREQFLFLRNEDYRDYPVETLAQIFAFLGLSPLPRDVTQSIADLPRKNKRHHNIGSMMEKTKRLLDDFYAPYTQKLARLLKDDKFLWKDAGHG